MNTVWQSLLWKEWHESRWKFASLTVMLFAMPLYMQWWAHPSAFSGAVVGVSILYMLAAPLYIAAGVCASEASGGTLLFLQATPVDRRRWAIAKSAMGLLTVVTPLLLLLFYFVVCSVIDPKTLGFELGEELVDMASHFGPWGFYGLIGWSAVCVIVTPMSFFIWSLAVGVNCRRELWAIAFSLGVLGGLWFLLFALENHYFIGDGLILRFALALLPGGFMIGVSTPLPALPTPPAFLAALVFHTGLLAWYVTQFGRSTRHAGHSPKAVVVCDPASVAICEPRKSQTSAILWMQVQEIAPLAVACLALILLPAMLSASILTEDFRGDSYTERLGNDLAGMAGTMGFFFAILIGVGVFLRDLEPGLNTFWRSRPIPPSQWFWTKFLSAFAMLLVAIGVPALFVLYLIPDQIAQGLDSVFTRIAAVSLIGIFALTSTYTTAVAVTVLVRHAIYGCLLSIGIVLITYGIAVNSLASWSNEIVTISVAIALQITLIAITTWIAWLAVTRDWGWKR